MTKLKKSLSIFIAAVMLISVFAIAPITASAETIPVPKNLRVIEKTSNSFTVAFDDADYSYQLVYGTKSTPDWAPRGSTDWWTVSYEKGTITEKIENVQMGKTYYVFVRFVSVGTPKRAAYVDLGNAGDGLPRVLDEGEYSMIKVEMKDDNATASSTSPSVKVKSKTIKASALKKSNQTIKPLTIKNAKSVKVVKVKKGTTAKIYKKITVKKKTGAIKFKKGKYKKGTYKIKLKIKLDSKTFKKTVKVKIK